MKEVVRNSLKDGLIFLAIGAAVAWAVPAVIGAMATAGAIHLSAAALTAFGTSSGVGILSSALIFGAFGVLNAVLQPVGELVFGKDKEAKTKSPAPPQINLIVQPSPQLESQETARANYAERITARRLRAAVNYQANNRQ